MKRRGFYFYNGTDTIVLEHEGYVIQNDLEVNFTHEVYKFGSFTKGFAEAVNFRQPRDISIDLIFITTEEELREYCQRLIHDNDEVSYFYDRDEQRCYMFADNEMWWEYYDVNEERYANDRCPLWSSIIDSLMDILRNSTRVGDSPIF